MHINIRDKIVNKHILSKFLVAKFKMRKQNFSIDKMKYVYIHVLILISIITDMWLCLKNCFVAVGFQHSRLNNYSMNQVKINIITTHSDAFRTKKVCLNFQKEMFWFQAMFKTFSKTICFFFNSKVLECK